MTVAPPSCSAFAAWSGGISMSGSERGCVMSLRLAPKQVEEPELLLGLPRARQAEPHAQRGVDAREAPAPHGVDRGAVGVGNDERRGGGARRRRREQAD